MLSEANKAAPHTESIYPKPSVDNPESWLEQMSVEDQRKTRQKGGIVPVVFYLGHHVFHVMNITV